MKKLLLFIATLSAFAACSTDTTEDVAQIVVPDCLQVSIADEESRMQLSNEKTVWTAGDKVSVFYKSDANQCWKFNGKTGDRSGTLSCVSQGTATTKMEKVVIVYPYSESYMITPSSGNIEAKLPAVQKYLHGSYGLESSPMISSGYYTQFALKNVCGWLKLQLSGTGTITKITLKGNNGEQLAGDMYINAEDATVTLASASVDNDDNQETGGTLVFEDSIVREVELDCDGGVDLSGADVTPFYIALPPTVFEKGFTATLHFDNGMQKEISTSKKVEITRNHIVPMETIEVGKTAIPNNQIWYTSTDGKIVEPYKADGFGANIISNTYEDGKGIITFDGDVKRIGKYVFYNCSSLKTITIPYGVTTFYDFAFYKCNNLTAFYGFRASEDNRCLIMGNGVFVAFAPYGLTEYTIPDNVTATTQSTFLGCDNLASITIPDNVVRIGEKGFTQCSNLKAFYGKFASEDNRCLIQDGRLVAFAPAGLTEYVIPDGVTEIGINTFSTCRNLTSVTIPNSVTTIGDNAFYGCSGLTDVNIGNNTASIGEYAFYCCSSLTSITIPDSVTSIGGRAFRDCSSLTSINIPDGVTSIEISTFYDCCNLTDVAIGKGVTSICKWAFRGCSSLTNIIIPDSVTSIGEYAFSGCINLTCIYCKPTIPPSLEPSAFANIPFSSDKIYVPRASVNAYKSATGWSIYASWIVGYTAIEPDNISIKYVTSNKRIIDNSAKNSSWWSKVVSNTYDTESNVGTLVIPKGSSIGKNAFRNITELLSIEIPDSITSIDELAFEGCMGLINITISDSVTAIGENAFRNCNKLTTFTIPDSVTSIGDEVFSYCHNLTNITIPNSVISIGECAFIGCYNLTAFYGKYTSSDNRCLIIDGRIIAFARSGLTEYVISNDVTSIGKYTFFDCSDLTKITIPDSVTSIETEAFSYCKSMKSIYCKPTTPPTLSSNVFQRVSTSANIYVPTASVNAYKSAEIWSDYASMIVGYDF